MDVQNISVAVRARPLFSQEESTSSPWSITNNSLLLRASNSIYKDNVFRYQTVFGPADDNATVYSQTAAPLVNTVLSGINCTLLAYGQTGSGKTHTILGSSNDPGVVPRAWSELFHEISCNKTRVFTVHATFLELYNEELRDLMDPTGDKLQVQQVRDGTCIIPGLRRFEVRSYEQIQDLLQQASNNRVLSATKMNQMSSRSHALFSLIIESEALSHNDPHPHLYSTLVVVDLAGSERTAKSGTETGIRRREREAINLSLLSLGMVISQLTEGGTAGRHVNYRNSLLTRLLQVSLGGNARTCMICTITPSSAQLDESISTLRFASNATKVKNRLRVNVESSDAVKIAHLKQEVEQLKKQGIELQRRLSGTESDWGSRGAADASWEAERSALVTDLEACRSLVRELQMENVNLQRQIKDKQKMEEELLTTQQMVKELKKQNAVLTANLAFEREMQQQLQLLLTRSQASLEDPPQYSELMQEVSHPPPSPEPHSMPSVHDSTALTPPDSHHNQSDLHHQRVPDLTSPSHNQQHQHSTAQHSTAQRSSSHSRSSSTTSITSPAVAPIRTKVSRQSSHESGIPAPRAQRSGSNSFTPRSPHTPDLGMPHEDYIAGVDAIEPSHDLAVHASRFNLSASKESKSGANFSSQTTMVFGQTLGGPIQAPAVQEPAGMRPSNSGRSHQLGHQPDSLSRSSSKSFHSSNHMDDSRMQRRSSSLQHSNSNSNSISLARSRSVEPAVSHSGRQESQVVSPRNEEPLSKPSSLSKLSQAAAARSSDSNSIPLAQSFYSGRGSVPEPATGMDTASSRHHVDPEQSHAQHDAASRQLPSTQILPSTPSVSEYSYRPSTASSQFHSSSEVASSRRNDTLRDSRDSQSHPPQVLPRSRATSAASLDFSSSVEFTSAPADSHRMSSVPPSPKEAGTFREYSSGSLFGMPSQPESDGPVHRRRISDLVPEPASTPQSWLSHEHSSRLTPNSSFDYQLAGSNTRHNSTGPPLHPEFSANEFEELEQISAATSLSQFRSLLEQSTQSVEPSNRPAVTRPPRTGMSLAERVESLSGLDHTSVPDTAPTFGVSSHQDMSVPVSRGVSIRGSYPTASHSNSAPVRSRSSGMSASVPMTRRSLSAIAASTQAAASHASSISRSVSDAPPPQVPTVSPPIRPNHNMSRTFGAPNLPHTSVKSSASVTSVRSSVGSMNSSSGRVKVDGINADSSSATAGVPPAVRVRLHDMNASSTSGGDTNGKAGPDGGVLRKAREAAIAQRSREAVSRLALLRAKTEAVRKQLPAFRFS